jgi:arabinogalactan endo-1,4-beta-galactosidase
MKTAMQEHFEWLQENQLYFGIPIEAIDNAEDLLEKEKEQIIETFDNGIYVGTYAVDKDGDEYYNQTYNQKQHIIDIMKADEDNGLYNQNKS